MEEEHICLQGAVTLRNYSFKHWAGNRKRHSVVGPGEKRIFHVWVDSRPHQKSTSRSGMCVSRGQGGEECADRGSWQTQSPWGHDVAPASPLHSTQSCGCFRFVYFFKGGLEHKLLLSISTVFHVCKALLPSPTPELPKIIKEFETPAKNSRYLADTRTYRWASGKAGTV